GVAVDVADDFDDLFTAIPLDRVSVSLVSSQPVGAAPHLAMYLAAAERRGYDRRALAGTSQNDFLMETAITIAPEALPPAASFRVECDVAEYCARELPRWNPISVTGYNYREAGADAPLELALTLAHGRAAARELIGRGLAPEVALPKISFFLDAHADFFEEIAKFRAARRIWARWLRDVYGAETEKAQWMRFHTQTAGVSLTAQQPYNNVVRTSIEALAAVLGGTNSLHTNALDETLALPSEQAAEIALRTQQVIMEETGVVNVADPLGGSFYVEALTDKLEAEANAIFDKILEMGGSSLRHDQTEKLAQSARDGHNPVTQGLLRGIEDGWFMSEIAEAAFAYQVALEKGEKKVVGVNVLPESVTSDLEIMRVSHEVETEQVRILAERRAGRDESAIAAAIEAMLRAAREHRNMIPPMLDACRAEATLGEICNVLREEWGVYREPARF
ncbi:MAG: methylmalonyl-CoA mutase, partial [Marmoricola sp.]|nr:methylmalonyl-CoA mutase [Marmoricola sp.]